MHQPLSYKFVPITRLSPITHLLIEVWHAGPDGSGVCPARVHGREVDGGEGGGEATHHYHLGGEASLLLTLSTHIILRQLICMLYCAWARDTGAIIWQSTHRGLSVQMCVVFVAFNNYHVGGTHHYHVGGRIIISWGGGGIITLE